MNNKMKKRTITGVAIISGAILFSVGVAGTVHLINENNAIEAKTYVTAKENNFNASTVTKEVNGIKYALNDSDYSATVISIVPPTSGSSKIIGESKDGKSIFVNIPQSVNVNNTYTVRYIGDGSNSLFASNFEQYCSSLSKKQVNVILPKTVYSVSANAFKKSSTITTINVVNVSNTTTFANQQNANLTICGVSGSGAENGAINNRFSDMYSYDKNDTKKTATIKGFSSAALGILNYLPDGVTVNFEIPTFISSGKYISTSIADNAFANKKFMKTLIIPGTVNSVGVGAFGGCSNINWVKFLGKNTSVSDNAFFEDTIDKIYALSDSKPKEFYTKNHSNGNYGINNASFNTLTLSSIDGVEQNPLKISYKVGEQLDTTGLVLKTTINDSGNPLTSYVASGFSCSPTTLNTSGNQTITVTYYDKTTTFVVNVVSDEPEVVYYNVKDDNNTQLFAYKKNQGIYISSGKGTDMKMVDGLSVVVPPTKSGYTFQGYYYTYSGKEYEIIDNNGNIIVNSTNQNFPMYLFNTIGGNITLTAKWQANEEKSQYTINFDANGGTGAPSSMSSKGGSITIPSSVPTKSGSQFWIWKIKGTDVSATPGGTFYSIESYADSDGVVTFIAQWGYQIKFDANGGTGAPSEMLYPEGDITIPSNVPTKSGKQFETWKVKNSEVSTKPGEKFNILGSYADSNGVITLVAQWTENKISVESVSLDKTEATLKEGENLHLIPTINPETATNSEVRWNSSNTEVATVKDGLVVAKSEGTTIITVTTVDGEKTATCKITVESSKVNVENIILDKTQATIKEGGNVQLTATVTPDNATNKNVSWESSNTAVATVDNTGYVTAKSEGTATITAKTEDGGKTATATITVEKEITDNQGPTIVSIKGEKDSEGNYKVIIKATDESGIEKVLVNGAEITTKDSSGNFYFIPTKNGTYNIEVYDTVENKTEQEYTENNIIEKTKITADKDSNGNNIVYIETITNKKVTSVKVNGTEIKDKDSQGRYYFKPTKNGIYKITVEYEDGTTEDVEYKEDRITNNNGGNNGGNNNNGSNNSGNNNGGNSSTNNSSNGSSSNNGTNTSGSNKGSGTLTSGKSTSGNTIGTSTALTSLPKTGTKMGAFFAAIASGITAVFAWFKQRKEK